MGRIESFEPVMLAAHGGDLNGFFLLKGEVEKLDEVRRDDTFRNLTIEANYCLDGFWNHPWIYRRWPNRCFFTLDEANQ